MKRRNVGPYPLSRLLRPLLVLPPLWYRGDHTLKAAGPGFVLSEGMDDSAFAERPAMTPGLSTSMLVRGNGQRRLSPYPRANVFFTFNGEMPPEGQEFLIVVTTYARSTGSEPWVSGSIYACRSLPGAHRDCKGS